MCGVCGSAGGEGLSGGRGDGEEEVRGEVGEEEGDAGVGEQRGKEGGPEGGLVVGGEGGLGRRAEPECARDRARRRQRLLRQPEEGLKREVAVGEREEDAGEWDAEPQRRHRPGCRDGWWKEARALPGRDPEKSVDANRFGNEKVCTA